MVCQLFVPVQVEVLNHRAEVRRFELTEAVLSDELAKLVFVEHSLAFPVDSAEGSKRLEFPHSAQLLPEPFDYDFLFRCENEDVS